MHIGNRLIAIPWYRLRLEPDEKTFLLNIDKETLENYIASMEKRT